MGIEGALEPYFRIVTATMAFSEDRITILAAKTMTTGAGRGGRQYRTIHPPVHQCRMTGWNPVIPAGCRVLWYAETSVFLRCPCRLNDVSGYPATGRMMTGQLLASKENSRVS